MEPRCNVRTQSVIHWQHSHEVIFTVVGSICMSIAQLLTICVGPAACLCSSYVEELR
jgi:hypothetical protein